MATTYASQTITITASTLADAAARESASVTSDTAVTLVDYRITVKPTFGTPAGTTKAAFVYVKTSSEGTTWDGNATASDAAITLDTVNQFALACVIPTGSAAGARGASFSLKAVCGSIPKTWGIIIENNSGAAFTALTVVAQKESVA